MFSFITRWRHSRIIQQSVITEQQWQNAFKVLPLLDTLEDSEKNRLRELSILFLHYKALEGAQQLKVTQHMALVIALQACLPVLNLGFGWYDGWVSVIIYPAAFIPKRNYVDESGVEHRSSAVLSGESWHRGPVILSWEDSQQGGIIDGSNLVIHEFAHKLDLLNGVANGFPPLHRNMSSRQWSDVLSHAFEDFTERLHSRDKAPIDSYAASSPAEFFAVFSEMFFEKPDVLNAYYPDVYQQFALFYKQDTLKRLSRSAGE